MQIEAMRVKILRKPLDIIIEFLGILLRLLKKLQHISISAYTADIIRRAAALSGDDIKIRILTLSVFLLFKQEYIVLPVIAKIVSEQ